MFCGHNRQKKKSLNVGYQNPTLCLKYLVTLAWLKPKLSFKSSYFWWFFWMFTFCSHADTRWRFSIVVCGPWGDLKASVTRYDDCENSHKFENKPKLLFFWRKINLSGHHRIEISFPTVVSTQHLDRKGQPQIPMTPYTVHK